MAGGEQGTAGPEELEVLKLVARRLNAAGIAYMLTGSLAMTFYAVPRMTRDLDVVVAIGEEQVGEVVDLFAGDFYVDAEAAARAARDRATFNAIHSEWIVKVDFIVAKDDAHSREALARRRTMPFHDIPVAVIAPEDLILAKLRWARESRSEMQLKDVRSLLGAGLPLDRAYLDRWAAHLGVLELYREVAG